MKKKQLRKRRKALCDDANFVIKRFRDKESSVLEVYKIHKELVENLETYDLYWKTWHKFIKEEVKA